MLAIKRSILQLSILIVLCAFVAITQSRNLRQRGQNLGYPESLDIPACEYVTQSVVKCSQPKEDVSAISRRKCRTVGQVVCSDPRPGCGRSGKRRRHLRRRQAGDSRCTQAECRLRCRQAIIDDRKQQLTMTKCKMGLVCADLNNPATCREERLCYEKPMDADGPKESAYKRCMIEQCSFCAEAPSSAKVLQPVASTDFASASVNDEEEDCSKQCRYQESLKCDGVEEQRAQPQQSCQTVQEPKLVCNERIRVPTALLTEAIAAAAARQVAGDKN